jgi:hypothetical protein
MKLSREHWLVWALDDEESDSGDTQAPDPAISAIRLPVVASDMPLHADVLELCAYRD